MFAPPPIQLSRDEIERRLSQATTASQPSTSFGEAKDIPLLRKTAPRRIHYFSKGGRAPVSSPLTSRQFGATNGLAEAARADVERLYTLPPGFAEHPRPAPEPPRRSGVSSNDRRTPSSSASPTSGPAASQKFDRLLSGQSKSSEEQDGSGIAGEAPAVSTSHWARASPRPRQYTVPSGRVERDSRMQHHPATTLAYMAQFGVHDELEASLEDDRITLESDVRPPAMVVGQHTARLDATSSSSRHIPAQHVRFLSKELPDTPTTASETPTELYHSLQDFQLSPTRRRRRRVNRRPTTQQPAVSDANVPSLGRLSAILEDSSNYDAATLTAGSATPIATQYHIRGGSVVTVTPPELTPWVRHVYIQGPIKLQRPVTMPRKHSVASLEPFQDVIDTYQGSLQIPRRRSDDQVLDDVVDFFNGFGFDSISFDDDRFVSPETAMSRGGLESDDEAETEIERFSTPPATFGLIDRAESVLEDISETKPQASQTPRLLPSDAMAGSRGMTGRYGATYLGAHATLYGRRDSATLGVHQPRLA